MAVKNLKLWLLELVLVFASLHGFGQDNVPYGINYQAVARDNFGKELANKSIDVRFSILSPNPLGTVVYSELHSNITTSKYGVFSLIIGNGTSTGGTYDKFSSIDWSQAFHYLRVEVKFENNFIDMGTMQFLAVPYALYAQKSLEPGPQGLRGDPGPQGVQGIQGLKGDQGDPASDDQTLSFNGINLSISGGNTVNLSTLNLPHQLSILGDTLSILGGNKIGLPNQVQDLQLDVNNKLKITKNISATEIDLTKFLDDKQQLTFNSANNNLAISGGNSVDLSPIKQDLLLNGNTLSITNKVSPVAIDLSVYLQNLILTPADNKLQISGGNTVDLTAYLQTLNLTPADNKLQISGGNTVDLTAYLQTLNLTPADNKLQISGGNTVDLTAYLQTLNLTPADNKLQISGGNTVDLTAYLQTLNLTPADNKLQISGGNTVDLTAYLQTLNLTPADNKLQISGGNTVDLTIYRQNLTFTPADNKLQISGGNTVDLTSLKNDADFDPMNEIQDLNLTANKLTITNKTSPTEINLTPYLDNTDNQALSYNASTYTLSLTNGGDIAIGSIIAFRARKTIPETGLSSIDYDFVAPLIDYNDGLSFDGATGVFTAPVAGIYTFVVGFLASSLDNMKALKLFLNGSIYETLNSDINSRSSITRTITMKLIVGDKVKVVINPGLSTESGTGSFSGFRVY